MTLSTAGLTADDLTVLFRDCFAMTEATVLVGGASEPFFQPGNPSQIHFREDYVRSALHEVAHWCVAGRRRRQLADYGYWYSPDGRDAGQQQAFFAVEARPQAIEWFFCEAIGIPFSPSVDNVCAQIEPQQLRRFEGRIQEWCDQCERTGLPPRAARFVTALQSISPVAPEPVPDIAA